jgi:hypothetical protein
MGDERKAQDRALQRSYESHRLEEQLWSLAYQEVWRTIRKRPKANDAKTKRRRCERSRLIPELARRA